MGGSWNFLLTVVTPLSLIVALGLTLNAIVTEGYGGYASHILWLVGGGTIAFFIVGAIVLSSIKDKVTKED